MEGLGTKPPKSVREYYIKLYCRKNKTKCSRGSHGRRQALQSWWSLTTAEQQPFIEKFDLIQEKYKENCLSYLRSVEPFMKRKVIRKVSSDPSVPDVSQVDNHIQPVVDNLQDINESTLNEDCGHNIQDNGVSTIDPNVNDSPSSLEIINTTRETEEISRIPEPTAPCAKNGKELFEMVTSTNGGNNLEWKNLSQVEKYKYQSAALAIKREYIKEYQNYLESLPPVELFQHYIKTLEKYRLFHFRHP